MISARRVFTAWQLFRREFFVILYFKFAFLSLIHIFVFVFIFIVFKLLVIFEGRSLLLIFRPGTFIRVVLYRR